MFVRAYLRASTSDQDANRARQALDAFAAQYHQKIASYYTENASGASPNRAELRRLLVDAHSGDVLLVESIDRLSRLPTDDWKRLRTEIDAKGLRVVALDLPTSHAAMQKTSDDDFTARMLDAINAMMLDMMAAIARKDYEQRRERQAQGVAKAKAAGKYKGRKVDEEKRTKIRELLGAGFSIRKTAQLAPASTSTVYMVQKEMELVDQER